MWRSVAIGVVLAGVLAGCSFGSNEAVSTTPAAPTSYKVTSLVKPMLAKAGRGRINLIGCAVEPRRRAKCDFYDIQGVGGAMLDTAWFELRPADGRWRVTAICRGGAAGSNPLCPGNYLHLSGS